MIGGMHITVFLARWFFSIFGHSNEGQWTEMDEEGGRGGVGKTAT